LLGYFVSYDCPIIKCHLKLKIVETIKRQYYIHTIMQEIKKLEKVKNWVFPGLGKKNFIQKECELYKTKDEKAYFILQHGRALVYFPTKISIPVYYEFKPVLKPEKIKAVLMDLDGTSVKSEPFWVWVIEEVTRQLLNKADFRFTADDQPFVSGHSVSEHLIYVLKKYCSQTKLSTARNLYFDIVHTEMKKIVQGRGKKNIFKAAPYLKEFLLNLKKNHIKIGVVSSGLYEKAWPELISAFHSIGLGNPLKFYDAIVTAGFSIKKGQAGTLGELESKPHPWLYAEALFALHVRPEETIAIEDSGAGILSIRTAGIYAVGVEKGNIVSGGERPLCSLWTKNLKEVWKFVKDLI